MLARSAQEMEVSRWVVMVMIEVKTLSGIFQSPQRKTPSKVCVVKISIFRFILWDAPSSPGSIGSCWDVERNRAESPVD